MSVFRIIDFRESFWLVQEYLIWNMNNFFRSLLHEAMWLNWKSYISFALLLLLFSHYFPLTFSPLAFFFCITLCSSVFGLIFFYKLLFHMLVFGFPFFNFEFYLWRCVVCNKIQIKFLFSVSTIRQSHFDIYSLNFVSLSVSLCHSLSPSFCFLKLVQSIQNVCNHTERTEDKYMGNRIVSYLNKNSFLVGLM